ncbi:MAG: NAD(P)/FAD-dependent oxidoreductase [bacterium]
MKVEERPLPRIVIVGAGFGGLQTARSLAKVDAQITLIDRNNYHLFQPLLYQVATAGLSAGDIAEPVRAILKKQENVRVVMAEVTRINAEEKRVETSEGEFFFDFLVLAPGNRYQYFGHDDWREIAPSLKSVEEALEIRRKILLAFERAEMEEDNEKRKVLLQFVVVGGGPTGVELAGAIAELAHKALARDFRHMDPTSARIFLVEAGPRILAGFDDSLSEKAEQELKRLGVEVKKNSPVEKIEVGGIWAGGSFLPAKTVLWAAGVVASPLLAFLNAPKDKGGRILVNPDLSVPGHPEIFLIGDAAGLLQNGKPLPGLAPVALQQGRYVAKVIGKKIRGSLNEIPPFLYFDKGQLATVGRAFAVAEFGKTKIAGFFAWLVWLFVHIFFLIGLENRVLVFIQWAWAYLTFERGSRVILREEGNKQKKSPPL